MPRPEAWSGPAEEPFNAAFDLLQPNLAAGRHDQPAFIDSAETLSYGALAARVSATARELRAMGLQPGERLLLCLVDDCSFPVAFLAAMLAGIVPVPLNTMLKEADFRWYVADSGARAVLVSPELAEPWRAIARDQPGLRVLQPADCACFGHVHPAETLEPLAATRRGDVAFWLYTSGSTGSPKAAMHRHDSLRATAELYAKAVAGIGEKDVVLSAAKLFFAYGLGNSLTFPLAVGATAVLHPGHPSPEALCDLMSRHAVTVFAGVPTYFARWLAQPGLLGTASYPSLRLCLSAGEPLPAPLCTRLGEVLRVDVIDGLGSTEMLHIFASQRPGAVRPGVTGKAVAGYELRVVDADGSVVTTGAGHLEVRGPSTATGYWQNPEKSAATFLAAGWVRTGDRARIDAEGWLHFEGRGDDMLKVNGMFVSPVEVEAALLTHPSVMEAALVGRLNLQGLTEPIAFVTPRAGEVEDAALEEVLKAHVRDRLPGYKCPRHIRFVESLPKTTTGKIQRFRLRESAAMAGGRCTAR